MAAPESAKESQGKGTLSRAGARARIEESEPHIFHCDDFVLLTDDSKCRLARIEDIYILEAFRNATLVHFAEDKFLIPRSLLEIERRLDSSIFFRASRDRIVNLSQVKHGGKFAAEKMQLDHVASVFSYDYHFAPRSVLSLAEYRLG